MFIGSYLIAQDYCMESWRGLCLDCWESELSLRDFIHLDLMDFHAHPIPGGVKSTWKDPRLLPVMHGIMYGETMLVIDLVSQPKVRLDGHQTKYADGLEFITETNPQ